MIYLGLIFFGAFNIATVMAMDTDRVQSELLMRHVNNPKFLGSETVPFPKDQQIRVKIFPHEIKFLEEKPETIRHQFKVKSLGSQNEGSFCEEYPANLETDLIQPKAFFIRKKRKRKFYETTYEVKNVKNPVWVNCPNGFKLIRQSDRQSLSYEGLLLIRREPTLLSQKLMRAPGLQAINVVDLETYVHGVVPYEMPPSAGWPLEAFKAQAVAARTYAYFQKSARDHLKNLNPPPVLPQIVDFEIEQDLPTPVFHVDDTVLFQVYGGKLGQTSLTQQSVIETARTVLVHEGGIPQAWFHASSGGHTEDALEMFEAQAPYAVGKLEPAEIHGDPLLVENWARHKIWTYQISLKSLENTLKGANLLPKTFLLKELSFNEADRNPSGRLRKFMVRSVLDEEHSIEATPFRMAIGMRSSRINWIQIEDAQVKIQGTGFGHGVGLNQTGAWQLAALANWDWVKILMHYYSNVELVSFSR